MELNEICMILKRKDGSSGMLLCVCACTCVYMHVHVRVNLGVRVGACVRAVLMEAVLSLHMSRLENTESKGSLVSKHGCMVITLTLPAPLRSPGVTALEHWLAQQEDPWCMRSPQATKTGSFGELNLFSHTLINS